MIGFLSGTVTLVNEKTLLLLTEGGVGYLIFPINSILTKGQKGKRLEVFIYTIVREQEISLYGFLEWEERLFFEKLIGISGIGPKIALQILNTPLLEFQRAVDSGDIEFISRTPGIGKKMAQKIVVELQGKLMLNDSNSYSTESNSARKEAKEALCNLGYDRQTIEFMFKSAPEDASTEMLIKYFLSNA